MLRTLLAAKPPPAPPPPTPCPAPLPIYKWGWQGGLVVSTLSVALIVMGFDWLGPDIVFSFLVALYTATGVLTGTEAAAGFSNNGLLTVMALYVVAEGIYQTGGLERVMSKFLGEARSVHWAQFRMMVPVLILSAFLNNTPIVSLLTPIIMAWCTRTGVHKKKMLIPLSYAAIFGGTITVIGTSTNLVISGYYLKTYKLQMGIFEIARWGVPYAISGLAYTLVASKFLLAGDDNAGQNSPLVGVRVTSASKVAGKTIAEAGLRSLPGLFLASVARHGKVLHAVPPSTEIEENDVLYFAGDLTTIPQLVEEFGLEVTHDANEHGAEGGSEAGAGLGKLLRIQVTKKGDIAGSTIKEVGFRARFHAAVVSVKRGTKRLVGRLGDIKLKAGDLLIVDAAPDFDSLSPDFITNFGASATYVDGTVEREFMTSFTVIPGGPAEGKSIQQAGLRGVVGLFLVAVERPSEGKTLHAVPPETILAGGDILWLAGSLDGVSYVTRLPGVIHSDHDQVKKTSVSIMDRRLVQAVLALDSPLAGYTPAQLSFRAKYDAAIVAIHRRRERLQAKIGDVVLQVGDVLILDTGDAFATRFTDNRAFALVNEVPRSSPLKTSKMWIAIALAVGMIMTQIIQSADDKQYTIGTSKPAQEFINLWPCALLTGALMLATRCLTSQQARDSFEWSVYLTIAFAFGVGTAMEKSRAAQEIADLFISAATKIGGKTAAFSLLYVATAILSEILTNNAAGAIMYPIASRVGDAFGIIPIEMAACIMLGASAGFTLPYSYQTHLMVYAAGDYTSSEFAKIGFPCALWLWMTATVIFAFVDQWYALWIATAIIVVAIMTVYFIIDQLTDSTSPVAQRFQRGKKWVIAQLTGRRLHSQEEPISVVAADGTVDDRY